MSIGIGKTDNEYAREVRDIDASKTVWMAIAFSFALRIAGNPTAARELCYSEWETLHDNGIVPQRPRMDK
jgi:hypothetical protein